MESGEERMFCRQRQDASFRHRAVDIIVLDDDVLLQNFHREQLRRALVLRQ